MLFIPVPLRSTMVFPRPLACVRPYPDLHFDIFTLAGGRECLRCKKNNIRALFPGAVNGVFAVLLYRIIFSAML